MSGIEEITTALSPWWKTMVKQAAYKAGISFEEAERRLKNNEAELVITISGFLVCPRCKTKELCQQEKRCDLSFNGYR